MNLKAIVRTYIRQIRPRAEDELEWFRGQPSLEAAIGHAALAVNSRGQRYSHQRRLRKKTLEQAREILLARQSRFANAHDFDEVFHLVEAAVQDVRVSRLCVYDTSLRLRQD
jgi:hypothetical protein